MDSSLPGRQTESPDPQLQAAYDYHLPRRLVVCLDGTWNKKDSGTNVYHISNLIQEGRVKDKDGKEWFQIIYYDEGVGTGLLDGVTGGAFGIGLSENVRQAYDWLVEKYREGKPEERPDDQIYVFGFSRGAFTARSLIGLIAKCGLLYRGAPISPGQLWNAYRILGRHQNPKTLSIPSKNWWEQIVGRPKKPFRLVRSLKRDVWESADADPKPQSPNPRTEKLLIEWSRRVKIHCVGIFDTVGSMGLDALAIPWLRSRLAQFHDTYLTSLIVNGFHALAIDEHRANFVHIPWHTKATDAGGATLAGGKVEQRWFIGAHSNIGGGYDDNMLAAYPLAWMIEKCAALGLEFRKPLPNTPDPAAAGSLDPESYVPLMKGIRGEAGMSHQPAQVRDSFADIAKGIWQGLIRSKREYRRISPPLVYQNQVLASSVNEDVHKSVGELVAKEYAYLPAGRRYNPPNLWEYWQRPGKMPKPAPSDYAKPKHCYLENGRSWAWLLSWLAGVGAAAAAFAEIRVEENFWLWPLGAIIVAFVLDFCESALNHWVALNPDGVRAELGNALLTLAVLFRLLILAGILFGLGYWLVRVWPWLSLHDDPGHLWDLVLVDALLVYFNFAAAWSATPMLEAGFGSIVDLQVRGTVARVREWLDKWGKPNNAGKSGPQAGEESEYSPEQRRQLLMPVAHTIFRDMFAFIPAYVIVLVVGNRLAFSCLAQHFALGEGFCGTLLQWWQPNYSLAVILGCALMDYVEDLIHLRYLRKYPEAPAKLAVRVAFGATLVKMFLFAVASVGLVAGIVCLSYDQIVQLWRHQSGGLSVMTLLLTAALLLPPVKATLLGLIRRGEPEN